jgi:hypothetical protein
VMKSVSTYDPAALVRDARIAERYRLDGQGLLDEDEAMRCVACGFASRLPGTPVFAWVRVRKDVEMNALDLDRAAHPCRRPAPRILLRVDTAERLRLRTGIHPATRGPA